MGNTLAVESKKFFSFEENKSFELTSQIGMVVAISLLKGDIP
jgi:hypothetical protein